jgi:hypothetical protein
MPGVRACQDQLLSVHDIERTGPDDWMKQAEAILARLYPIEQTITHTPARRIAGLGVKARYAAYAMSQYWEEAIDQIEWEAQALRSLIEAVCEVARASLRNSREVEWPCHARHVSKARQ